ncbi:DUF1513 domain-containing protein [Rhodoligotrophos defluvii]|uniref:DUF1513 domain-containing protein n=1 Tax=Rhodoligotrophos defluvii TaxID=2561934 RepID=UPI0014854298|nr:DUF1513 domain-containing protein [Rhodoligotrophos defluvii]
MARASSLDRRAVLAGLAALPLAGAAEVLAKAPQTPLYLSAFTGDDKDHFAVVFDDKGKTRARIGLPARGHGGAFSPVAADTVIFARRPGTFAVVFDRRSGRVLASLSSPEGRHFFGHGIYDRKGRVLYTTENAYESGDGVIGVWDARDGYRRVGEFPSFGIDPHDIRLMPDGYTLAIANGGILTHPDLGRRKLNIPEMSPSLVLVDARTGKLVSEVKLPRELHKLSIRHMAVNDAGQIGVAMQYEGPRSDLPPLVFIWRGKAPQLLEASEPVLRRMSNYCGSAALDESGSVLGISAPRGGIMTFWSMADGRLLDTAEISDGCGIAAAGRHRFLLSSGDGSLSLHGIARQWRGSTGGELPVAAGHWDNHIIRSIG